MKLAQNKLNEVIKNWAGEAYEFSKEKKLTVRALIIEVIFATDPDRSGDERLKGYNLANKISAPLGDLILDDDEVKLIEWRMETASIVNTQDYLYGKLHDILKSKEL